MSDRRVGLGVFASLVFCATSARAQAVTPPVAVDASRAEAAPLPPVTPAPAGQEAPPSLPAPAADPPESNVEIEVMHVDDEPLPAPSSLTASGYIETYYAWNFNRPSNNITNWRAFDNRHNTFTLSNAVIALDGASHNMFARIALQAGTTGEAYYASEPMFAGSDGAGGGGPEIFKHVQEAYAGFQLPFAKRVKVDAGLFLSPIGPESMAIKDTFTWSRSNLFYALPFYHTGARVAYAFTENTGMRASVYNGWNSVLDNNDEKSISLKFWSRLSKKLTFDAQYFSGVERAPGAAEGRAWRHLLDTYVTYDPTDWLSLIANADVGIEPNRIGTSGWLSGALFARVKLAPWLFVGARGDAFYEKVATNSQTLTSASPIFWPAEWVMSQAIALDARPHPNASVRLEYRHDASEAPMFFRRNVETVAGLLVSNARSQDTITLGLTAWF